MTSNTSPKRKNSSSSTPNEEHTSKKQAVSNPPPMTALPPPLMPYPPGHFVQMIHPQQPYYHMYPQAPIYLPVSPQQHPTAMTPPPTNTINNSIEASPSGQAPRILPKQPVPNNSSITSSPLSSPARALYPQPPPSPFYHPYSVQMSPTMLPTSRHGSISSSPSLGAVSTADQREKARKISHSAIERRRRERINDKIIQLKQLIPSCAEQDNLHKMSILQSAIDYITYLKEIVKNFEDGDGNHSLLKGDHLKVKMTKSMLPKEVEKFTSQFSVHEDKTVQQVPQDNSLGKNKEAIVQKPVPTVATEEEDLYEEDLEDDEDEESMKENTSSTSNNDDSTSSQSVRRGLKPMDVIQSGTPLASSTSRPTPLTPPHEPVESVEITDNATPPTPTLYKEKNNEETISSETLLMTPKPDEVKHMSLQNILC